MVERRIYEQDPIQEAICEFRFAKPDDGWGVTLPGLVFERLRDEYSAEPVQQPIVQAGMSRGEGGSGAAALELASGLGPVRLSSKDGTSAVQVGPKLLSVHSLRPYKGWDLFAAQIERALTVVADVLPSSIQLERIGVRYINRVTVPAVSIDTDEYFSVQPMYIADMGLELQGFIARSEHRVVGNEHRVLIATFASTVAGDGEVSFILDLDAIDHNLSDVSSIEASLRIVRDLREFEREAFEGAIRDKARELFGGYDVARDRSE